MRERHHRPTIREIRSRIEYLEGMREFWLEQIETDPGNPEYMTQLCFIQERLSELRWMIHTD